MCVHAFRSWASELNITRLGPIPKLGPTGARNFLSASLPLATCYSMLNAHPKSIHYVQQAQMGDYWERLDWIHIDDILTDTCMAIRLTLVLE